VNGIDGQAWRFLRCVESCEQVETGKKFDFFEFVGVFSTKTRQAVVLTR
jgi:hypothetical protein